MSSTIGTLRVELPDAGLQVHGLQAGRGAPLLLLHGWPEWSHAWRPVMSRIASPFELVAPDLRGFGDTLPVDTSPRRDIGPERHAADLLELADRLGWDRFGIVSHDVGSFVAQAIARRAPQRVAGLFFFNCVHAGIGARWGAPRHLREIWYQSFHQQAWAAELVGSSREACRIYLRHFLSHWSHRQDWIEPALDAWVDQFMKPGRLQGGFNWYGSVHEARLAAMEGRTPPAAPIAVPTRVLWGAHDPVLKAEWVDRLPETFADLEVSVQPEAGHFVHLEQPDAAASAIASFFAKVFAR
jgi:pimeloyl-ACP methyl ester carboxylesterase